MTTLARTFYFSSRCSSTRKNLQASVSTLKKNKRNLSLALESFDLVLGIILGIICRKIEEKFSFVRSFSKEEKNMGETASTRGHDFHKPLLPNQSESREKRGRA